MNDTFNQIEKSWQYAEHHSRTLALDTTMSGLNCEFSDLFEIHDEYKTIEIFTDSQDLLQSTKDLTTAPKGLTRRSKLFREEIAWIDGADRLRETGEKVAADLDYSYDEERVINICRGGGADSAKLLQKLRVTKSVSDHILAQIAHLPHDYVALHIRNTDVKSNYKKFLSGAYKMLSGHNVLICSDDHQAIEFAQEFLDESRILTTNVARSQDGSPLHAGVEARKRGKAGAVDALVDLAALARSQKIYFPKVSVGLGRGPYQKSKNLLRLALGRRSRHRISGFVQLALFLQENPSIRRTFLREALTDPNSLCGHQI